MNRFVLKNNFTKIYIYHFLINIFIKISSQSYALETVSLSKTTLFFLVWREYNLLAGVNTTSTEAASKQVGRLKKKKK